MVKLWTIPVWRFKTGLSLLWCIFYFILGGADQRSSKLSYGTTSDVELKILETDITLLSATITLPSGRTEACALKKLGNGNIGTDTVNLLGIFAVVQY